MISRYSMPEISKIWTEDNKYNIWLKIELLVLKAWLKIGKISKNEYKKICENSKIDVERIKELEKKFKHDVIAFTRMIDENIGEEKRWLHYGLTSTDIVDTANSYMIKQSNDLIYDKLSKTKVILLNYIKKYKYTPIIGRTHGIHAEPTTLGYKMSIWLDEIERNIVRFILAREQIEVCKISGSVGTFANVDPYVEEYVSKKLSLKGAIISNQTLQRDRHAFYISTLALVGSTIEKICTELRNLQRSEINEIQEGFSKKQKGSSSMPHKKNPITSENLTGCARLLRGYMVSAYENIPLWGERDISHSSCERIILPDATTLIYYMLSRFNEMLENLVINEKNMKKNIESTNMIFVSQRLMNLLICKGYNREESYDIVQKISFYSMENSVNFLEASLNSNFLDKILTKEEIKDLSNMNYYYSNIDKVLTKKRYL